MSLSDKLIYKLNIDHISKDVEVKKQDESDITYIFHLKSAIQESNIIIICLYIN